jgi:hypothetical protein
MNFKEIIKDSARFAVADWFNFVILGIIILILDLVITVDNTSFPFWLDMFLLFLVLVLILLEAGYIFRILSETVKGSVKPPKFNRFISLFIHGLKETVTSLIYIFVPLLLYLIGLDMLPNNIDINLSYALLTMFLILGIVSGVIISLFYQGALLNMANNNGTIKSGFNFPEIWRRVVHIGIRRLFLISVFIFFILYIVKGIIYDSLHTIPIVGDILASLIVIPFLTIFTTRMLGLMERP